MNKKLIVLGAIYLLFSSHDMFLKMDSFYLQPDQQSVIALYNGTFNQSDNTIDRDRMIDVSIVSPAGRQRQPDWAWEEKKKETHLKIKTGKSGTYVAGVSTKARMIELSADDFNGYLEHDGILDMIDERKAHGHYDQAAKELYSKHVKAIFQVGENRSDQYKTALNYPIEFVPLSNPYDLDIGDKIEFQLLLNGNVLANQLVYSSHGGHDHSHTEGEAHSHDETQHRTNQNGVVQVAVDHSGHWYVRTIHMVRTDDDPEVDYESNWATLTFEVK